MNDPNDHKNVDYETQAFDAEDRVSSRHNNEAYNRFVKRVKQTNFKSVKSDNKEEADNHHSSKFDPLSEEELAFFSDEDSDKSSDFDEFEYPESPVVGTSIVSDKKPIKRPTVKNINRGMSRKVSSVKLLVLGVIFGLLLSGVVISIMYPTGILSTLSDRVSLTTTEIAAKNSKSSTTKNESGTNNNKQEVVSDNESTGDAVQDNKNKQDNITYEAFREEAKTTLYRETDK